MGFHREPLRAEPHDRPGAERAAAAPAPARLVLIVGGRQQPQRAWADCLAERGLRCIWEGNLEHVDGLHGQVMFDAVVADVTGDPGAMVALLSRLRPAYGGRVLVLSDSRDEIDEIMALELGADDYLSAPVSARRLRARLLALLRTAAASTPRVAASPSTAIATATGGDALGGWQLDAVRLRLARGERVIGLTATQCQLLQCLAHHAGRLVPRAELHERVCPEASDIRARTIDVYMHRLRRRLHDEGVVEIRIEAVRGRGFVLHAEPRPAGDAERAGAPAAALYLKA